MKKELVFIILISTSLNLTKFQQQSGPGEWTTKFSAKPQYTQMPSQYFICGFYFLEQKWNKLLWNCQCGMRWYKFQREYRCNWCDNVFWSKSSGISIVFCHYKNWNEQIVKNFTTASPNSGNWRDRIMCPQNSYATGFKPKFGVQHEEVLGFTGMSLKCTTVDYKSSQNVQDNPPYSGNSRYSGNDQAAKYGSFLSGFEVKYQAEGKLTGFAVYAEGMAIISQIQVKYDTNSGYDNYPVNIGGQVVENCLSTIAQKKVTLTKTYKTTCRWNHNNPQTRGYAMLRNVSISPPDFLHIQDFNKENIYKEKTSQFGLQTPVTTSLSSDEEILVFVAPYTEVRISTVVQQNKGVIPYSANLSMTNMVTGQRIINYPITGMWTGMTISSVSTKMLEIKKECQLQTSVPNNRQGKKSQRK